MFYSKENIWLLHKMPFRSSGRINIMIIVKLLRLSKSSGLAQWPVIVVLVALSPLGWRPTKSRFPVYIAEHAWLHFGERSQNNLSNRSALHLSNLNNLISKTTLFGKILKELGNVIMKSNQICFWKLDWVSVTILSILFSLPHFQFLRELI